MGRRARRSGLVGALRRLLDRRARTVGIGLLAPIALSTICVHLGGNSWLVAPYLALTAFTATGGGDLSALPVWRSASEPSSLRRSGCCSPPASRPSS